MNSMPPAREIAIAIIDRLFDKIDLVELAINGNGYGCGSYDCGVNYPCDNDDELSVPGEHVQLYMYTGQEKDYKIDIPETEYLEALKYRLVQKMKFQQAKKISQLIEKKAEHLTSCPARKGRSQCH